MVQGSLPSAGLSVEVAQHSDPGRDPNKQINEDSCGHAKTKFGHLCVLCDGMGGHYGGQEASRRAITTIFEQIEKAPPSLTPCMALKLAVEEAGRRVYELGGPPDNKVRPGSTVVAMLLHDGGVDVAHVGDSRAYVIRSNQIYPLTRDHSMVQTMIDAGFLTEEQAIGHPDANKITRALGMKPEVDVEVRPEPMELFPGDVLIQSSDGLTDLALGHEILAALRQALNGGGIEFACQQLVRMANERGGHDNITVQIARVLASAPSQTRAGQTKTGPSGLTTVPEGEPTFSSLETVAMGPESQRPKPTIPMAGGAGVSPTVGQSSAPRPLDSHPSGPSFGPHGQHGMQQQMHAEQPMHAQQQMHAEQQMQPQMMQPQPMQPQPMHSQPMHSQPMHSQQMHSQQMHSQQMHSQQMHSQQVQQQTQPQQMQPQQPQQMQPQQMQQPMHSQQPQQMQGVSPTLGAAESHGQQGLVGYRMDAPQGLGLPPPSMRYPQQPQGSPQPPHVQPGQPTPHMTPAPGGYGAPNGQPYGVGSQTPWGEGAGPLSGPASSPNRNVLFLWLGVSFFVATTVLIIVYVLVLR